MSHKNLLITGFDPFGGESVNPSWEAVKLLPEEIGPFRLHKLRIPTIFGLASQTVLTTARQLQPHVILCVGQAAGRCAITPERIAINVRDARIGDNQGNQPRGEFIDPNGPAAYFASVDVTAMATAIDAAGLPAAVSNSAGTFVCNETLYSLLHHCADTDTRVGFIHIPQLPQQTKQGAASMPLEDMIKGLTAAIAVL